MPIVSTIILSDVLQANGHRHVIEEHTDEKGQRHTRHKQLALGTDALLNATTYQSDINNVLRRREKRRVLRRLKAGKAVNLTKLTYYTKTKSLVFIGKESTRLGNRITRLTQSKAYLDAK